MNEGELIELALAAFFILMSFSYLNPSAPIYGFVMAGGALLGVFYLFRGFLRFLTAHPAFLDDLLAAAVFVILVGLVFGGWSAIYGWIRSVLAIISSVLGIAF